MRFLSRQLHAIFVALKLHQISNMFESPAILRRQIALKTAPGFHVSFWSCNLSPKQIASSCRDKNRLYKWALSEQNVRRQTDHTRNLFRFWFILRAMPELEEKTWQLISWRDVIYFRCVKNLFRSVQDWNILHLSFIYLYTDSQQ